VPRLKKLWSNCKFQSNVGIKNSMSRDRYFTIRRNIGLDMYEHKEYLNSTYDPIYSTRPLLENFLKKSSKIAVPTGALTLDEATLPTRARNLAVSYMPKNLVSMGYVST